VSKPVYITCDSTCDLPPALLERFQIRFAPLTITLGEENFLDDGSFTTQQLYARFREDGTLPQTAAVSPQAFMDFFRPLLEEGYEIVHIDLSSELSSTYQNAVLASREFDNVFVVDSRNVSVGHGMVVLKAARLAESGAAVEALLEEVKAYVDKVELSFILGQLDYLHKSGRCSSVAALGANLLKLKPCVDMKAGKLEVGKKYRGGFPRCAEGYVTDRLNGRSDVDRSMVFIIDSGVEEEALQAARRVVAEFGFEEVVETQAGCTISCHCGPGAMGIVFARK